MSCQDYNEINASCVRGEFHKLNINNNVKDVRKRDNSDKVAF